ncbi:DNA helicase-2 / ATP-dependent DNA helicase PcrA [Butyrivibrio sp. ob235]|nr:DNA helicase-2 / ATP-dependent DNA helicase PcrA [Butyrivibrio sp. ob235]
MQNLKPDMNLNCNPAQKRAIMHDKGPACVIAGPGSGKTFVIIQRIISLIRKGVNPGSILTITFTKAAAIEMQQRFIKETNSVYPEVLFGTFHSIFYHILNSDKLTIIKETDKYKVLSHILHGRDYDSEMIRLMLSEISRLKNSGLCPEERDKAVPFYEDFPEIYEEYTAILKEQGLIDFDDMVLLCRDYLLQRDDVRKKWQDRLEYIQIDEYQDINLMQFEVIKLLLGKDRNLFVVGDDDQSIYGFRGSDPELMLGFKDHFEDAEEIILDTNYRCAPKILEASKSIIDENKIRFKKDIKAGKKGDLGIITGKSFSDKKEQYKSIIKEIKSFEANAKMASKEDVTLSDFSIIVRTNVEATAFAGMLGEAGIPCSYKEKVVAFHEKAAVKDMISYLSFIHDGQKRSDFLRIMNKPVRYISRAALEGKEKIEEKDLLLFYARQSKINMTTTVQKLFRDLKLMSKLSPKGAVHFIRGFMGYDKYLKDKLCASAKVLEGHMSDLDEFEKLCENFRDYQDLKEYIEELDKTLEVMRNVKVCDKKGVRVMTMHASKGLEFKRVYLPDLNEGIVPSRKSITSSEIEEERRMLYVAMTRAKEELHLSYVKGSKENPMRMSGFLRPIRDLFRDGNIDDILIK